MTVVVALVGAWLVYTALIVYLILVATGKI